MDSRDELIPCPYNKAHWIVPMRMPAHLIKCAKSYRGEKLVKCPYNACHLLPEDMLEVHFATCKDYLVNYST